MLKEMNEQPKAITDTFSPRIKDGQIVIDELNMSEEEIKKVIERTSLGRMAEKEEIANAVLYLASDKSAFVTGHILNIDGGRV